MNLDIFRSDNKTGKFSREKWVMENYIEELNSFTKIPICSNASCNNKVKFLSLGRGYTKYCSNKCVKLEKEKKSLAK